MVPEDATSLWEPRGGKTSLCFTEYLACRHVFIKVRVAIAFKVIVIDITRRLVSEAARLWPVDESGCPPPSKIRGPVPPQRVNLPVLTAYLSLGVNMFLHAFIFWFIRCSSLTFYLPSGAFFPPAHVGLIPYVAFVHAPPLSRLGAYDRRCHPPEAFSPRWPRPE